MNVRLPVSMVLSVLLTLVMAACAGAAEVKLTASDGAAGDWFGIAVSISGDYAIVSAISDDDNGDDSGSAYIYKRDVTGWWGQQAKITASDGTWNDWFGYSVSISGDYAIVGAPYDDDRGDRSGSAYIYKRDGTTWSQQAKLTASDGAAGDWFGVSVSISGDYVIVGATYRDDDNSSNSGSSYIYKRDGTTWSEQAKFTASDGATGDEFGISVSISGDYVIVGAHGDADRGSYSGSAYIYKRDGTTWSEQAKINNSDGSAWGHFGGSVSISGDYAIVGAYGKDGDNGSAYIFKRNDSSWTEQTKITASDGVARDEFGISVSIYKDCAIVGALFDDDDGENSGSAYIYKRDGTTWNEQVKIVASDGATHDHFGKSVSISGDRAIVGAPCDNDNEDKSGSAYIYDIRTTEPPITGDLNGDYLLTPADAVIALLMAAGSCEPTTAADVSSDGVVNSLDALMILQAVAGLIAL
ncbi:MAG: dockerin type I domain-containing protein [Euryarchaeota archaeon]|nr:dockerin type I domain-containing protein [Euryarchaeota archaeon]